MKNVIELASKSRKCINSKYDLRFETMNEIRNAYKDDIFNLIVCAFSFGYLQGEKATKAEIKKGVIG